MELTRYEALYISALAIMDMHNIRKRIDAYATMPSYPEASKVEDQKRLDLATSIYLRASAEARDPT